MANKKDGPPKEPKAKKPKASGSSRKGKNSANIAANTTAVGTPPSSDSNHASSQPPQPQQPPPQQTPPQPQTPQQQQPQQPQQQPQQGVIPRPSPQHQQQQQQPPHMMYPQHSQYPPQPHQPPIYYPQQQYGPPTHQMQGPQQMQPHLQHYPQQAQPPHPSQHPTPGYMASPYPNQYPNQTSPSPHHISHSPHGPPHPSGYSGHPNGGPPHHPQILPSYSGSQAQPHHQGQPLVAQQHPAQPPPPPQPPHMQHHQHMPHPPTTQPHPRPTPQYPMHPTQQQVPGSQSSSQPHLQQHMPPSHPHQHHPQHPPAQQQSYPGGQFAPPHQQPPHMMYQQQPPSQYPQHQASMYYQQQPAQGYQSIQQQPYGPPSHQMQHHQQMQSHLQHYSQQPQPPPHPGQHPSPGYMASPYTNQSRSPHHMSHSPHGPPHPSGYSGHPSSGPPPPPQHYSQAHPPSHMQGSYSGSQPQPHHPSQTLVPAQHQTQPPPQHPMHHQHIPHPQPAQHPRPPQPSQYPMHTQQPVAISQPPSQTHPQQHLSPSHPHQHHASHTPHPPTPQQPYPGPGQGSQFAQPPQQPPVPAQTSANHPPHHANNQHHHHPQQSPAPVYPGPQHGPAAQPHAQPPSQHTTQPSRPSSTGQQAQQPSTTAQTPPNQVQPIRREITFPPGSVEATQPTVTKRRKLTCKDVSSIEVWRLFMCLKSGLLAEASWAIDVLGILLNDDATIMQFALQNLPGLLEAILEHYKRCLNEIFEGFAEDTMMTKPKMISKPPTNGLVNGSQTNPVENDDDGVQVKIEKKVNGFKEDESSSIVDKKSFKLNHTNSQVNDVKDQMIMFSSRDPQQNYTYRTRDGKKVTLKSGDPPVFDNKTWDLFEGGFDGGISHWKEGNGEDLSHIQVFFEPKKSKEKVSISDCKQNGEVELEDEADTKGEQFFNSMKDCLMTLARRCICLSTLIRNLSFVPGNDTEMSKHAGLLLVLGRLLLLKHKHAPKRHILDGSESTSDLNEESIKESKKESDKESSKESDRESKKESHKDSHKDSDKESNKDEEEWYWSMLHLVRENTLVTISNISSSLDLSPFNDRIVLSLLEGLLHWAVCPSSYALDPFPTTSMMISPQRLSFESLAKLSIIEGNVDLILATPPWSRLEKLFSVLSRSLGSNEDQTIREFALVLLSNLASAGSSVARTIALTSNIITQLISFIEAAEATAQEVERNHGHEALKDPEATGTTLDMLRRAAHTLKCMSQLSDNHPLFVQHQQRLLSLVMSRILDPGVVPIIADVIFEISSTS